MLAKRREPSCRIVTAAAASGKPVVISWASLEKAFHEVRCELAHVGLLEEGRYLDQIDLTRTYLPLGSLGYVFDKGAGFWPRLVGFEDGVIYVAYDFRPTRAAGNSLVDTIRHEFAHAWAWLDRRFVDGSWFRQAFDGNYDDRWSSSPDYDANEFVSAYACESPKEDFAETFMVFLRHPSRVQSAGTRRGVARKLRAVQRAVRRAARERVRLPRFGCSSE